MVKKWGYVSLGSITAAAILPVLLHFFRPSLELELAGWGIAILIVWKHRENIKRLLAGKEKGLSA